MSAFKKLVDTFKVNWTTMLVGWNGLGELSPWPERADEFPPLLSAEEVVTYANERIGVTSDAAELELIVKLLSIDPRGSARGAIRDLLARLAELDGGDAAFERRKWRLILLEDLLEHIPSDPVYGLTSLSAFWQSWGFPSDSPHEVQGRGNAIPPSEYFREQNFRDSLIRHRAWLKDEKVALCRDLVRSEKG